MAVLVRSQIHVYMHIPMTTYLYLFGRWKMVPLVKCVMLLR